MNKVFRRLRLDSMNPSLTQGVLIPLMRFCSNSVLVCGPVSACRKTSNRNSKGNAIEL